MMHLVLFERLSEFAKIFCFVVCISVTITYIFSFYDVETKKRKEWSKENELLQRKRVVYVKYYLQESQTPGSSHSLITIMVSE